MFYKMSIRKIMVSVCALIALTLIYMLPKETEFKQELEYIKEELTFSDIFLVDTYNFVSLTEIVVKNVETISRAKELITLLTIDSIYDNKIPSGFRAIIPSGTEIISVDFVDNILKVNFNKTLLEIPEEMEEKLISSIIYTLTSIEGVEGIILYVDGAILTKLPSGKMLPSLLDRNYGINKSYDLTSYNNINSVNVYYVSKNDDKYYYVPVTKYVNDQREKIVIVIDEMTSSNTYNTNLLSFLNSNTKLIETTNQENILNLEFNNYIFDEIEESKILEEVLYTIALSVKDNYDVNEIVFKVDDTEIHKTVLKTLD